MANQIRSPGFGPGYWNTPGGGTQAPSALPMSLEWDNPSAFEISELNTFTVNLSLGAVGDSLKTRGWDYTVTIENNTDPTNVYLTNDTGSMSVPGSAAVTLHFKTDSFLAHGAVVSQPSAVELQGKFGPVYAGDADPKRYFALNRTAIKQPTAYRNCLVESIVPATGNDYPNNFDHVTAEYNKFAILLKIERSNATAPVYHAVDYKMFIITFTPLIDIN